MYGVAPRGTQVAQPLTVLAPIKGWNTRDALAEMDPQAAFQLDNWFPRPDRVVSRGGTRGYATTGVAHPVEALMEYVSKGVHKLFMAVDQYVFDCSVSGAAPAPVVVGLSNARLQHVEFSGPGGQFLYFVNGADNPRYFDGTNWAAPAITGSDATTFIGINVYRGRLFFVKVNSTKFAYLGMGAVAGAALDYDCGQFLGLGGSLMACATWTVDGGSGPDDLFVVISTEGEVIVFQGTDPSMSTNWQMIQRFVVGKPLGRRCFMRYGADLCLLLQDGFYRAGDLLKATSVEAPALAISDDIRPTFIDQAAKFGGAFGWQAIYYPLGQRVIVNVPDDATEKKSYQYVQNSITNKWCRYTNVGNTNGVMCWTLFNGQPYFGDQNGNVFQAEYGNQDNGSVQITCTARQAFNYLEAPGINKQMMMLRPRVSTPGTPALSIAIDVDFRNQYPNLSAVSFPTVGSIWNVSLWNVSAWAAGEQMYQSWFTFGVIGEAFSVKMIAAMQSPISWYSTQFLAEGGGPL